MAIMENGLSSMPTTTFFKLVTGFENGTAQGVFAVACPKKRTDPDPFH